jgi:hypothetical protein
LHTALKERNIAKLTGRTQVQEDDGRPNSVDRRNPFDISQTLTNETSYARDLLSTEQTSRADHNQTDGSTTIPNTADGQRRSLRMQGHKRMSLNETSTTNLDHENQPYMTVNSKLLSQKRGSLAP